MVVGLTQSTLIYSSGGEDPRNKRPRKVIKKIKYAKQCKANYKTVKNYAKNLIAF